MRNLFLTWIIIHLQQSASIPNVWTNNQVVAEVEFSLVNNSLVHNQINLENVLAFTLFNSF